MKRIETKEIVEKKSNRNKLIIGLIMIGILVLSTAGYAFYNYDKSSSSKVKYNKLILSEIIIFGL